jgi:hypothetical protein
MPTETYLSLREPTRWALLTCSREGHRAGDVEVRREGAFYEARCRECARDAGEPPIRT